MPDGRNSNNSKLRYRIEETLLAVTRPVTMLQIIEEFLLKSRPPHPMEVIPLNEFPLDKDHLSQTAVRRLMRKHRRWISDLPPNNYFSYNESDLRILNRFRC